MTTMILENVTRNLVLFLHSLDRITDTMKNLVKTNILLTHLIWDVTLCSVIDTNVSENIVPASSGQ
jgi:hypothetical protein